MAEGMDNTHSKNNKSNKKKLSEEENFPSITNCILNIRMKLKGIAVSI